MTWCHDHKQRDLPHSHADEVEAHSGGPHVVQRGAIQYLEPLMQRKWRPEFNNLSYDDICRILSADEIGPAYGRQADVPWRWIESTRELQTQSYGLDPWTLEEGTSELADFISWNAHAAHVELAEFAAETGWKPWAKDRGWLRRAQAVEELVDVMHFVANLFAALRVTDEEFERVYRRKQQVNRDRMASGEYGKEPVTCAPPATHA